MEKPPPPSPLAPDGPSGRADSAKPDSPEESRAVISPSGAGAGAGASAALVIGGLAACVFAGIAGINIAVQGLYYDEIHQVPAALAYRGKTAQFFAMVPVGGKPLMTMTYSGAVKSALYGTLLRLSGSPFTVESWRWFSIVLVALTFPLFALLARRRLSSAGLLAFFTLLVTDSTIVLASRHDWGPAALALALRMIFLGTWLFGYRDGEPRPRNSFFLGLLVGFSVYEKLSNIVLLPVLVILLLCRESRRRAHRLAAFGGLSLGAAPLAYANLLFYSVTHQLLSNRQIGAGRQLSVSSLLEFLEQYLSLGNGTAIQAFILGQYRGYSVLEALLLGFALVVVLWLWRASRTHRLPAILVACYLTTGLGLFLLPNKTWIHHWIIGTPFQYLAIAMAIPHQKRWWIRGSRLAAGGGVLLLLVLAAFLALRVQGALELKRSLERGACSDIWDPSLTRLGEAAARRAGSDLFVAANWGVGLQGYCLSNGYSKVVRELQPDPDPRSIEQLLDRGRFRSYYVVAYVPDHVPGPAVTRRLISMFEHHPNLREVPVEKDLDGLAAVKVRRFVLSDSVLR